jgi:molybdenum cofactor cytidylyltransferase
MTPSHTFGLIPAAGRSSRMGRPKLLLPLGGLTVLERVVAAFRAAGVQDILVVVPPHLPQLAGPAAAAGAHVLRLGQETPDMRATVECGLAWLEERFRPGTGDGWLLSPADHPALEPAVIGQLFEEKAANPGKTVFVPTHGGRRGHPVLIAWGHVAGVRRWPAGQGLNSYLRAHEDQTVLVGVDSADVLLDLDTPEDYERLLGRSW